MSLWHKPNAAETATKLLVNGLTFSVATCAIDANLADPPATNGITASRISLVEASQPDQFQQLFSSWRKGAKFFTNPHAARSLPEYKSLVGMGVTVIPRLISELLLSPNVFTLALLEEIAGYDPVSPKDYGDLHKMTAAWVEWFEQNDDSEASESRNSG